VIAPADAPFWLGMAAGLGAGAVALAAGCAVAWRRGWAAALEAVARLAPPDLAALQDEAATPSATGQATRQAPARQAPARPRIRT
jgi:hypothetical protein